MKNTDIIMPNYNHSILNTINSILNYYNVYTHYNSLSKLDEVLASKQFKNIYFLILDGMGENIINKNELKFFKEHKLDTVTSVFPSGTTAALTSYYSGLSPQETGWIGWSQYFKEYGRCIDMFSKKDSYSLESINTNIDVFDKYLSYKNVVSKIEEKNSNLFVYDVEPSYAKNKCSNNVIAENLDDILRKFFEFEKNPLKKFVFAYSDQPDAFIHKHGVNSNETRKFMHDIEEKIKSFCDNLGDDSLLIISADHGHKDISKVYNLNDYPELINSLVMLPYLEDRFLTFWVKSDMRDSFERNFNSIFKNSFILLTKDDFLNKYHFLGLGDRNPKVDDFIGDFVAISVDGSIINVSNCLREIKNDRKSTHCGMTKEEMLVDVLTFCK